MSKPILYSVSSDTSISHFDRILKLYLTSSNQVMPELDKLISYDAQMPMAHLFKAYLLKLASDPRFNDASLSSLQMAQSFVQNEREAMHTSALTSWLTGDMVKAAQILEQLLIEYPKDILAIRIVHHFHFYSGDAGAMKASVERVAQYFDKTDPFYSYLLGMQSFGSEEAGDYEQAERLGRQAVALDHHDQWATHAVAHVLQMQSRFDEGVDWLADRYSSWPQSNNFIHHVHWHEALFELGRSNPDRALQIYDGHLIAPLKDDFYLDVCNAASLLARLEMLGMDVSERWQALTEYGQRALDTELVFCSLHYLMAPARLNDKPQIEASLRQFNTWKQDGSTQGQIVTQVGEPIAQAMAAIAEKRYTQASELLASAMPALYKIGGSHAQRALFTDLHSWVTDRAA